MTQLRSDINQLLSSNKTIYEVQMLSDRLSPAGTFTDAFGRLRISQPVTLFDSFNRYQQSDRWAQLTAGSGSATYNANDSVVSLNVTGTSGDKVYRETKRVFAYQPGKSLLVMNTFVFNAQFEGLRQRVGYFGEQNGIFLEDDGTNYYLVRRSYVSGSVVDTRISQADWNFDKFDGSGYSAQMGGSEHQTGIDFTKAIIFWIDIEWLGVGDVRCGFVINGKMIPAHIFHHDNIVTSSYMTTACLPLRYEIENTSASSSGTLKQICSTVISEGGYELAGQPLTYGIDPSPGFPMATAGTYYPVLSLRINPSKPDSIAIIKGISVVGINNANYRYKLIKDVTLTGGTFVNVSSTSSLQYNSNNSATFSGGTELISGYFSSTNQATSPVNLDSDLFRFQFERNSLANTYSVVTLAVTSGVTSSNVAASIDWQEIT